MRRKFIIFTLILISLSSFACANDEMVFVNNKTIVLNKDKCTLSINDSIEKKLDLTPKCIFVKENNLKKIEIKFINDINSYVLIIIGRSVKNHPDFPFTKTRNDCGSQLQAIIIPKKGALRLSKVITDSITCAAIGVDEKEFWIISH